MKLKHPEGGRISATDSDAGMYLTAGWVVVEPPGAIEPPSASATKQEWIDYAQSRGLRDDDLAGKTKADLIAALHALGAS